MLMGVERLVDLAGTHVSGLTGATPAIIASSVHKADTDALAATDGHFASVQRDGQTVRLARTIGIPLRYFVAKMFHGPFLVTADRIDTLYEWCREQKIGWQFDPLYTRMIPAHYLVEIDQIGCPDPAPRYRRFFDGGVGEWGSGGVGELDEAADAYVRSAYESLKAWLAGVPDREPVGIAFSGGIDSTSVLLMAQRAMKELGRDASLLRAFTLDLGGGKDAGQAEAVVRELGLEANWEVVRVAADRLNLEEAIAVIEDYHPLDVECAAAALCLLGGIRERYPSLRYLLDGDGGDENLKSYPLEDSDLTISSVLRNPLLYQEGWGVDAIKHSLTYSGGLSRSYVRTYAPARRHSFDAFSPYTTRSAIAASLHIPFHALLTDTTARLSTLKAEVVRRGIRELTGIDMPTPPKRRFQEGAGDTYRTWKVGKAWCRQVFLHQWESRLRESWDTDADRISGNAVPATV